MKPLLKKNHPLFEMRKCLNDTYQMLYENDDDVSNDYKKKNWYQVIHSLNKPFDFIFYDQTYLLKGGIKIHQATRLKLVFPKENNQLLFFSGYLAHNDAADSLQETHFSSFNFMNSLRLFSYVDKVEERLFGSIVAWF